MISFMLALHILASAVWVGGLFFSYVILRPVLSTIESEKSARLWADIFKKFFPWVWLCIVVLLATGFVLISLMGGFSAAGLPVLVMMGLGILMMAIFKFVYVAPYKHLTRGLEENKPEVISYAMGTIRNLVLTNLILGCVTIAVATLNRF